MKNIIEWWCC